MKLILEGHKFELTFHSLIQSRDFEYGEYGMYLRTKSEWIGVGIVRFLDSTDAFTFSFRTGYSVFTESLEGTLFNTRRSLSWGQSLNEFNVIDKKKVVDWMAGEILKFKDKESLEIPDLNIQELIRLGAIFDKNGQMHMGI